MKLKHTRLAAAVIVGLACAMPAAAQTSGSGQASSGQSSAQEQNASGGQTTDLNANRGGEDRDWGWLGLLGLAGLLGLRRRDRGDYGTPRRTTT